ncbi:PotD/PotF family extracellular solute-binding protein [Neobittarella massiliensis]|uniref:Spermidine/putrescine ABC transporter substrate-binding protein n=2 Tax=Oscillospiraceae TaxID=216572 RepID=A0A8J6LTE0_9FIRM|nr:spermidine/putrescine ABC transporter substrate-binding protein [Neobittarella massiliensis]MBC3515224.1 spermidine/putrescine ABC transporter substrate-binding protein [Neobittarella massiliensis]SCJ61974.1 Spermidine/putrescine-binding periplasmic protein precursor [uncultured Anaerotruncus sp.]
MKKRVLSLILALCTVFSVCFASLPAAAAAGSSKTKYSFDKSGIDYQKFKGKGVSINVYNWGLYIAEGEDGGMNVVKEFEELTGIKVNYTMYATNEEMYAKLKSGGAKYDVIFPSDYMVGRMIEEDMILPLDFDNIPNYDRYIDDSFKNLEYDPQNLYSVPYTWGIVGILYNADLVKKPVDSWDILWDPDYTGDILMFNNSRDAFGIALKRLGYSMNTTDKKQLQEAAESLKKQKTVVQAYVMDEIFDKLGAGEAAIAPYYAGDYPLIKADNPAIEFAVPKEGTNRFVDAVCIPKDCNNKEAAELFINFLCDPVVGYENFLTIGYSSPNKGTYDMLPDMYKKNEALYPDQQVLDNAEGFINLDTETNEYTQQLWTEVLSDDQHVNKWLIPIFITAALGASLYINISRTVKKRRGTYK